LAAYHRWPIKKVDANPNTFSLVFFSYFLIPQNFPQPTIIISLDHQKVDFVAFWYK